jgi:cytochrome c-type biogenesis protein CcmH/NrfG
MPDLLEPALLAAIGLIAAAIVARPLLRGHTAPAPGPDPVADAVASAEVRHRVALEALRDVEADRRAGSLDDPTYARLRAEAEAEAARTLAELDRAHDAVGLDGAGRAAGRDPVARRLTMIVGAALVVAIAVGYLLPAPVGLASQTVDVRQRALERSLARVEANPRDPQALSQLADALLATGDPADRARGAQVLIALIALQPENVNAYRRLITAYIEAGDYRNAAAATDSLAEVASEGAPDVPFFRGLIARGEARPADAAREFERFLELAPDDPRAPMIRRLLDEADVGG